MPARNAEIHLTIETTSFGNRIGVVESATVVARRYENAIRHEHPLYEVTFANNGQKMYVPTVITGPIMGIKGGGVKYMDLIPGDYSDKSKDKVFSVPMELHVVAKSQEDALMIATHMPVTFHANDGSGPHTLIVAADSADDVDVIE